MPSWGAPAGSPDNSDNCFGSRPSHNSSTNIHGQSPGRYQRPGPYPNGTRGRQNDTSQMRLPNSQTLQMSESSASISSDNSFRSQTGFSADNPFRSSSSSSPFSPDNPYSSRDTSSPIHYPPIRPLFQSSPLIRTPVRAGHQRYNPNSLSVSSFNTRTPPSGQPFQQASPNHHISGHRYQSNSNRSSHSGKRALDNRNGSFSNPGGSDNIQKYVHPSMLEDPWRDLPATPVLQTY